MPNETNQNIYWYSSLLGIYIGDMRPGDRPATPIEIKKLNLLPKEHPEWYTWSDEIEDYILVRSVVYQTQYDNVTNLTEQIITTGSYRYYVESPTEAGGMTSYLPAADQSIITDTYIDFSTDNVNQQNMHVVMTGMMAQMIPFPYSVWQGTKSLTLPTQADVAAFLTGFWRHIETVRRTGAAIRAALSLLSDEELKNFTDPRLTA